MPERDVVTQGDLLSQKNGMILLAPAGPILDWEFDPTLERRADPKVAHRANASLESHVSQAACGWIQTPLGPDAARCANVLQDDDPLCVAVGSDLSAALTAARTHGWSAAATALAGLPGGTMVPLLSWSYDYRSIPAKLSDTATWTAHVNQRAGPSAYPQLAQDTSMGCWSWRSVWPLASEVGRLRLAVAALEAVDRYLLGEHADASPTYATDLHEAMAAALQAQLSVEAIMQLLQRAPGHPVVTQLLARAAGQVVPTPPRR